MKHALYIFVLSTLLILAGCIRPVEPTENQQPEVSAPDSTKTDSDSTLVEIDPAMGKEEAIAFAMSMAPGWNLGNNLDAVANGMARETCWGNSPCTQATMDAVRAAGFRSVRIPVSWIGHIGTAPDYTLDRAWLKRVAEVVGYARKAGLKAIINIHHDGNPDVAQGKYWLDIKRAINDPAYNQQVKDELSKIWTQIALYMAEEGDYLIFEDLNEINDGAAFTGNKEAHMRVMNEWNQAFVTAVRKTGGQNATRYLAITSFYARCDLAVDRLVLPKDDVSYRLMVAVHSYDPWNFAGAATEPTWGHTGTDNTGGEVACRQRLLALYNTFVCHGVPVYMGECGAVNRADARERDFQLYYMEYYARAGYNYKIPFILWDNGTDGKTGEEAFGFLNHSTGDYINHSKPLLDAFVRAQTDPSATYTLNTIYDRAPR